MLHMTAPYIHESCLEIIICMCDIHSPLSVIIFSTHSAAADADGRQVVATGGAGLVLPPAPPADEAVVAPEGFAEEKEEPVHDMDTS